MTSSYETNNYDSVFKALTFLQKPKKIVEIGIFNGFSLDCFINCADKDCQIYAYDLFEEYEYKHQRFDKIKNKYSCYNNVSITQMNFQDVHKHHTDNSIDILHIDISNNGDTYKFAIENYMPKVSKGGLILLEGGSKLRDEVEWMETFNFPEIRPIVEKIKSEYRVMPLEPYPSLTIIKK